MGYQKGLAGQEIGFDLKSRTTGAAVTGATVSAYRVLNGGSQQAVTGTVTEEGHGQYVFAPSADDIGGEFNSYLFRATGAISVEKTVLTGNGVYRAGQTGQYVGFNLVSTTDGTDLLSATVTVYVAIDGQAQGTATGTVTEKGNGQYGFAPSIVDISGSKVSYLFTASGAVNVEKTITTVAVDAPDTTFTGAGVNIQNALVAFVANQGALTALIGNPPRFYPEFAPDNAAYPRVTYTLTSDNRPNSLDGSAGFGEATFLLECWGDESNNGHIQANDLQLALFGVFGGIGRLWFGTDPDTRVWVQFVDAHNGQKASPPPAGGLAKGDARATIDLYIFFDDL